MASRRVFLTGTAALIGAGALGYAFWPDLEEVTAAAHQQRRLLEGDPAMADLVRLATLAANGHNSQPWRFRLDTDRVSIHPDLTRRTEVVDPDDHHLYVSLGCAAENLVLTASAHGRRSEVAIASDDETTINVTLSPGPTHRSVLYQAIPHRQSTRSVYDGQPISTEDLAQLTAASRQDGVEVLIFTEASDTEKILEFVVAGNSAQMDDPAFIAELAHWLRFSPDRAMALNDGLFSACSGNPIAPEWVGRQLFRAFFTKDSENDKYRDHIRSSAGIAVFVGAREDPESWINVGRAFQRFALQATALGIRNAHLNMPIEVPAIRPDFANAIGIPGRRPDLVVRFGRAPALPMSLRRPVTDLLI